MKLNKENFYSWCFAHVLGSLPYDYLCEESPL